MPAQSAFTNRCLQLAYAIFLLVVSLIALNQIVLSLLIKIESQGDRAAWIGFWGNIAGGAIGLIGAIAAALAAVYVLQEQIKSDKRKKQESLLEVIEALSGSIHNICSVSRVGYEKCFAGLKADSLAELLVYLRPMMNLHRRLDASILIQVAALSPAVAIRREALDNYTDGLNARLLDADKTSDDVSANPTDKRLYKLGLGVAGVLAARVAGVQMATAHYVRGLLTVAKSSGLTLSKAEELAKIEEEMIDWSLKFKDEGIRLNELMHK